MSAVEQTVEEFTRSLTGFEEIAIEKHLDFDIYLQGDVKGVMAMRALVFVAKQREGLNPKDAKQAALGMSFGDVVEYFAEDEVEIDPDEPETPSGEDSAPDA